MKTKKFQRTKEDFTCEHCGTEVKGDGYTNHCPQCLWSKHVDVYPGDRASSCDGIMKPDSIETKSGEESIVHQCIACGHKKKNKISPKDNRETIFSLV